MVVLRTTSTPATADAVGGGRLVSADASRRDASAEGASCLAGEPIPRRARTYRNHHLDSTRWDGFRPRPGDVVISTCVKAGTTWLQRIMSLLVFGSGPLLDTLFHL